MKDPPEEPVPGDDFCPRCGYTLKDGWCLKCSRIRQLLLGLALWMILPLGGFWACLTNLLFGFYDNDRMFLGNLGMWVFYGSSAIGLVLFLWLYFAHIKGLK